MSWMNKHEKLERNSLLLLACIIIAILIGGLVEVVPLFRTETVIEDVEGMRPYTPLELVGQNIYIRENCSVCHSQQIRPLRDEVVRYGHYSLAAESKYDHPFLWGSKRIGPDLARVGGKYSDDWQVGHLNEPRDLVPESIMPSYGFLLKKAAKLHDLKDHLRTLRLVGVPYSDEMIENAQHDAMAQVLGDERYDVDGLLSRYGDNVNVREFDGNAEMISEMDALVAYLQVLGTMVDFSSANKVEEGAQ